MLLKTTGSRPFATFVYDWMQTVNNAFQCNRAPKGTPAGALILQISSGTPGGYSQPQTLVNRTTAAAPGTGSWFTGR